MTYVGTHTFDSRTMVIAYQTSQLKLASENGHGQDSALPS